MGHLRLPARTDQAQSIAVDAPGHREHSLLDEVDTAIAALKLMKLDGAVEITPGGRGRCHMDFESDQRASRARETAHVVLPARQSNCVASKTPLVV